MPDYTDTLPPGSWMKYEKQESGERPRSFNDEESLHIGDFIESMKNRVLISW